MGDAVAAMQATQATQAMQDAIVRSAYRGITVVEGGTGTGKTVVALHRAAYVLAAYEEIGLRRFLIAGKRRDLLSR